MKIKKQFYFFRPFYKYKILSTRRELVNLKYAMMDFYNKYPTVDDYKEIIDTINQALDDNNKNNNHD